MKLFFGAIAGVDEFQRNSSPRPFTITTSCYYWISTCERFRHHAPHIVDGYLEQNPLRHVLYDIEMKQYGDSTQQITVCPKGYQIESSRDDLQSEAVFPFFCIDSLNSIFGNKNQGFDFWSHNVTSRVLGHSAADSDIVYIGGCSFEETIESVLTCSLEEVRRMGVLINERDQALDKSRIENGQRLGTNGSIYF